MSNQETLEILKIFAESKLFDQATKTLDRVLGFRQQIQSEKFVTAVKVISSLQASFLR